MSLARLDNLFVCLCLNYSSFHWKVNMKNLQLQVVFEQFFDCGKARVFDTSVIKNVPLSLVIGLFFCQLFCFVM